jgi:ABC-type nitrate/sulfonate/bicarbonate transport system substrate-binding protein
MTLVLAVLPSELPAQERYTVSYGGFAGYHAPLWAAKDLGLFAKHGLNADPVMISGSPRGMQAVLSGSSHFAFEKLRRRKKRASQWPKRVRTSWRSGARRWIA